MAKRAIFLFFILSIVGSSPFFSCLTALDDLEYFRREITLSNFSEEERERNLFLADEAYFVLRKAATEIDDSPSAFISFLELSYRLANCFQQNDRAVDSEIALKLALDVLEKKFPSLSFLTDPQEICALLKKEHPLLPALYAALLHYRGKVYFYKIRYTPCKEETALRQTETFLQQALALRREIDLRPDLYEDLYDSGKEKPYYKHTFLFARTQGDAYFIKGDFTQARAFYEGLLQDSSFPCFERKMICLSLIKTYLRLARREGDLAFYTRALPLAEEIEAFICENLFSGMPSACIVLAEFYMEPNNPYSDLLKAKNILEKAAYSSRKFSKERTAAIAEKMATLYARLAQDMREKARLLESELEESHFASLPSPLLDPHFDKRCAKAMELAKVYRKQKLFLQAALLLSNLWKQAERLNKKLQEEIEFQLFLTEKECLENIEEECRHPQATIEWEAYREGLHKRKEALARARVDFSQKNHKETCWKAHRQLTEDLIALFTEIAKECFSLFYPFKAPFAFICYGSLAREIPSPYSDLEFVLAYDERTALSERRRFAHVSTLFLLKLFSLGETPFPHFPTTLAGLETSEGIRPDAGGLTSHSWGKAYAMRATPSELISLNSSYLLALEWTKGKVFYGSLSIAQELEEKSFQKLAAASFEEKAALFWNDFASHGIPLIKINAQGQKTYSLKHSFLRAPLICLSYLSWQYAIKEKSPEKILQKLETLGALSSTEKEEVDSFLREIIYRRNLCYLQRQKQAEEVLLSDVDLEEFIFLSKKFCDALRFLVNALPYCAESQTKLEDIVFRTLCDAGRLEEAEKRIKSTETRGDAYLLRGYAKEAYEQYVLALKENPQRFSLFFKLAEAAIQKKDFARASKHLQQAEETLLNREDKTLVQCKIAYLKSVLARCQGDWRTAKTTLFSMQKREESLVKQGCLIHGLIELEKGRVQQSEGQWEAAQRHFLRAESLLIRKYGPLHPVLLPVYEEILQNGKGLLKNQTYKERIERIRKDFPFLRWRGALNALLLD